MMHSPNYNVCKPDRPDPQKTMIRVYEPRSFEDVTDISKRLIEGDSIALNLGMMASDDPDMAQRAVDFIAGTCFAVDGHQKALTETLFIFTPANTKISVPTAEPKALPPAAVVNERRSWWTALGSVLFGGF
jgi:cell division inhibitor SepF